MLRNPFNCNRKIPECLKMMGKIHTNEKIDRLLAGEDIDLVVEFRKYNARIKEAVRKAAIGALGCV